MPVITTTVSDDEVTTTYLDDEETPCKVEISKYGIRISVSGGYTSDISVSGLENRARLIRALKLSLAAVDAANL